MALFDGDPEKAGRLSRTGLPIYDTAQLADIIKRENIDIVVIAVPATAAEAVFEQVMDAGIRAVLNFAPVLLNARPGVRVRSVDMSISLESLSYFLARPQSAAANEADESLNGFQYQDAAGTEVGGNQQVTG